MAVNVSTYKAGIDRPPYYSKVRAGADPVMYDEIFTKF